MTTEHEKQTVATPHVSAIISNHGVSIDQAVNQAIADTTKPSAEQSAAESSVPGSAYNKGLSELVGRFGDLSSSDPSQGGSGSTGVTNTPVGALLSQVENMFDPAGHDPTQKGDLNNDLIRTGPTLADLRDMLGAAGATLGTTTTTDPGTSQGGTSAGKGGLQRPDGPPDSDPSSSHDPYHARMTGMLSDGYAGPAGTAPVPVKYDDEGVHYSGDGSKAWENNPGLQKLVDKTTAGPTADAAKAAKCDEDDAAGRPKDPSCNSNQNTSNNSNQNQDHHSSDNTVWVYHNKDGSTTVNDYNNHTTTTLNKDGSSDTTKIDDNGNKLGKTEHTPAPSIPDEDHQGGGLPPELQKEMHQMLVDASKSLHQPTHENDNVDARDDVPGAVSVSHTGPLGDHKATLLGGDRSNLEGVQNDGGGLSTQPNYNNSMNGARDPGIDDVNVQTNGREERDTTHHINTDPTRSQNAGGNGSGGQHTDGQQNGGSNGSPGTPVETAVQRAAEKLQHVDNNHAPGVGHPLTVHEKVSTELGHAGVHPQAGSDFAELIRLAQNPAQFGALNAAQANAGGAPTALHLPSPADLAAHGGVHDVDSAHAPVTAHIEPVQHDHAFDLHGVTAVFDHSHFGH